MGGKAVHENPKLEEKMREMVLDVEKGNPKVKKDWEKPLWSVSDKWKAGLPIYKTYK